MRINHNIASLNTYRQLSINNMNTGKSLEKLSSGLRINKAGDDAAGLAISEKMRAQVRGLDQAMRNSQDGISMLQTAEGALNEVHSILQRMRELATQAANDTNVKVDRDEIQKEINQLTSEINRIGNTTEFNTQKLLNGGTTNVAITTNTKGVALAQGQASSTTNVSSIKAIGFIAKADTESTEAVAAEYTVEVTTGKSITINAHADNGANSNSLKIVFASSGLANDASASLSGDTLTISLGNTAANNTVALIEDAIQAEDLSSLGIDESKITVSGDDLAAVASAAAIEADAKIATAMTGGVDEVLGVYSFELTSDFLATLEDGDTISIAGKTFTAKAAGAVAANGEFDIDATSIANTLASIEDAVKDVAAALHGVGNRFDASISGNSLVLTERTGEATGTDLTDETIEVPQTAGDYTIEITNMFKDGEQISFGGETFKAVATGANAANGQFEVGTSIESQAESLKAAVEAKLGGRFTATIENNKIRLVEKAGQATGEDLAISKIGNVEGTISYKQVAQSDLGTAAVWNTGAVSALGDDNTGTFTFNGVTVNISSAAAAVGASSDAATKSVSITIANGDTAASDTATAILNALNDYKANGGDELDNFTFDGDENGITITDATDAATGIATNGDNNNGLLVGATGGIVITNKTNTAQLATLGKDAIKAEYTFDITNAFKENETIEIGNMVFKGVSGEANALLGEFSIDGTRAQQAESLKAAIEANTALNNSYEVTIADAKITLKERIAGQETEALTAPITELVKGTSGVYSFKAQIVDSGMAYNIDGVEIKVVSDTAKYHDDIAAGKAVLVADNVKDQAENLRRAINANAELSQKYTASGFGDNVKLTQVEGTESTVEPTVSIGSQGSNGKFIASFQIGANSGQSMSIEIEDMRSLALKISGSESGTAVSASNGKEASYVTVANVSNGTDNVSVEYALDVSDHKKASAAISVIQDAIESVSAQRSQLGAYQNRLEHTINNLGTSSENMTAAESRIRDVDMAKEMMEFTKNNILNQASQAMLAQANQQPQGILQLLR